MFYGQCAITTILELSELLRLRNRDSDLQDVESDSLGDRSTLADNDNVTLLDTESWRNVSSNVSVSLLVSVVLWNVVQVVPSDDDGSVHLGRDNSTSQNSTSDGNKTGERTLLVNVVTLDSGLRSLETQTNILVPSLGLLVGLSLWVGENVRLLVKLVYCFPWNLGNEP